MITDSDLREMVKIAVIELALLSPYVPFTLWLRKRAREAEEMDDEPESTTADAECESEVHEKTTSV